MTVIISHVICATLWMRMLRDHAVFLFWTVQRTEFHEIFGQKNCHDENEIEDYHLKSRGGMVLIRDSSSLPQILLKRHTHTHAHTHTKAFLIHLQYFFTYSVSIFNRILTKTINLIADPRGLAVYDKKRLRPLEHWDRGFESHSRHGYLFAFILCLCCSV
jgi:hypothetical protein